jgi:hypothetical protein
MQSVIPYPSWHKTAGTISTNGHRADSLTTWSFIISTDHGDLVSSLSPASAAHVDLAGVTRSTTHRIATQWKSASSSMWLMMLLLL